MLVESDFGPLQPNFITHLYTIANNISHGNHKIVKNEQLFPKMITMQA